VLLSAERTGNDNGLEGELVHAGRDTALAPLAVDYELLPFLDSECHGKTRIGEYMAKVQRLILAGCEIGAANAPANRRHLGMFTESVPWHCWTFSNSHRKDLGS
jgi:hypothetical protein